MIRSLEALKSYLFEAQDGDVGRVEDFYFDDQAWTVRYLVLETGRWLPGRKFVVSPESIASFDWRTEIIGLDLTRETIENSPRAEKHEPVSQQHLGELHSYYGWPAYWSIGPGALDSGIPIPRVGAENTDGVSEHEAPAEGETETHLRSIDEVLGYSIEATDGSIGEVIDFGWDDQDWTIRYLVVDTRRWLPGKRVVLSPDWVSRVEWGAERVHVDLPKKRIENSPPFDARGAVNREYEEVLYDFYGRPKYWAEDSALGRQARST